MKCGTKTKITYRSCFLSLHFHQHMWKKVSKLLGTNGFLQIKAEAADFTDT